jgi:hypothetical protein
VGTNLRPHYLALGAGRRELGSPPVLAATATAPPYVRAEIADVLHMDRPVEIAAPAERRNIDLPVVRHALLGALEDAVVEEASRRCGTGLVYVGRRCDAETLAMRMDTPHRPALAFGRPTPLSGITRVPGQSTGRTLQAVRLLEAAGVMGLTADLTIEPDVARWTEAEARVEAQLAQRSALLRARREMIDSYVDGDGCRWAALPAYLGAAEVPGAAWPVETRRRLGHAARAAPWLPRVRRR